MDISIVLSFLRQNFLVSFLQKDSNDKFVSNMYDIN